MHVRELMCPKTDWEFFSFYQGGPHALHHCYGNRATDINTHLLLVVQLQDQRGSTLSQTFHQGGVSRILLRLTRDVLHVQSPNEKRS